MSDPSSSPPPSRFPRLPDKTETLSQVLSEGATGNIDGIDQDGFTYDYCIAFRTRERAVLASDAGKPVRESVLFTGTKGIVRKLRETGFVLKLVWSQDGDTLFVKIHTPLELLRSTADLLNLQMQLDPEKLRAAAERGVPDPTHEDGWLIKPIHVNEDPSVCIYDPYSAVFASYERTERVDALFLHKVTVRGTNISHPFNSAMRLKITHILLYDRHFCGFDLNKMIMRKDKSPEEEDGIFTHFALHNKERVAKIEERWIQWFKSPFKHEPFNAVRDYFGEQITMYFCFLHHYYTWLLIPGAVGLGVQINVFIEIDTQATLVPVFIVLLSVWCVTMLEMWKRRQAEISVLWGTTDYEESETNRPSFHGEHMKSPIDGKDMLYYPRLQSMGTLSYTYSIVSFLMAGVVAVVVAIFFLRYAMLISRDNTTKQSAPYVASLLNAISIQVLNYFYGKIARGLTDFENHRTDTQHVDALIAKLFAFQFINSYSSFYYIAFVQGFVQGTCGEGITCMDSLAINTAIIFIVALTVGNFTEVVIPLIISQRRLTQTLDELEESGRQTMPMVEFQSLLEPYDSLTGSMEDYLELAVQYGYVVLFAAAFPAAPLLAFVVNYFEYRFDALKLLKVFRRPMPRGAEDIGTWQTIYEILTVLSVITNAGLLTFAFSDVFGWKYSPQGRLWTFIIFQYTVLGFMFVIAKIIPDRSPGVEIQHKRQEFFIRKIVLQEPDEDDTHVREKVEMHHVDAMITDAINDIENPDDEPIHQESMRRMLPLGDRARRGIKNLVDRPLLKTTEEGQPVDGEYESKTAEQNPIAKEPSSV